MVYSHPLSAIDTPDDPSWRNLPGYRPEVGRRLAHAYAALAQANNDYEAYYQAYVAVYPYRDGRHRDGPLCPEQRRNVEYVLARAYAGTDDIALALGRIENAMESASYLADRPSQMKLYYMAARLSIEQNHLTDGVDHYRSTLALLEILEEQRHFADLDYKADLLLRLAMTYYNLARYDAAASLLEEAHPITLIMPASKNRHVGTVGWLQALLLQQKGHFSEALITAIATADIFRRDHLYGMAGRIQVITANIALDIADRFASDELVGGQHTYMKLAKSYINSAAGPLYFSQDGTGLEMMRLARIRLNRLQYQQQNSVAEIEKTIQYAKTRQDAALLGRAYIAMGDHYLSKSEFAVASSYYGLAWDVLEEYELHAMSMRAGRALFGISEDQLGC